MCATHDLAQFLLRRQDEPQETRSLIEATLTARPDPSVTEHWSRRLRKRERDTHRVWELLVSLEARKIK